MKLSNKIHEIHNISFVQQTCKVNPSILARFANKLALSVTGELRESSNSHLGCGGTAPQEGCFPRLASPTALDVNKTLGMPARWYSLHRRRRSPGETRVRLGPANQRKYRDSGGCCIYAIDLRCSLLRPATFLLLNRTPQGSTLGSTNPI